MAVAQLIVILLIAYLMSPYLRINFNKTAYNIEIAPAPKLEGNLAPNHKLTKAEYFAKGNILGPETIMFINNTLYAGLANGQIVKLDKNGNVVDIILKSDKESIENCKNVIQTSKDCGCILGMRYKAPDEIYFIDPFNGIAKVNLFTKKKTVIITTDESYNGKKLGNLNDIDVDNEGNIYFSQASTEHTPDEGLDIIFEGAPFGRLFHYNENTKKLNLLIDGIAFANGVQLTPDKDAVLVSELSGSRLLKYFLKGNKQGTSEVFLNLPGSSDNLRLTDKGTLLVPLVLARSSDWTRKTMLELFGNYPTIRAFMNKIFNIPKIMLLQPKYSLIVEYDFNGNSLKSWHDPTGLTIDFATNAVIHEGKLYIGSFYKDYIGVVDY